MRRILCTFLLTICLLGCTSCKLLEDVGGWDVSACASDFGTCWELFWNNSDKFEDGFVAAMNALVP